MSRLTPGTFRLFEVISNCWGRPSQDSRARMSSRVSPFSSRISRGARPSSSESLSRSTARSGTFSPRAASSLPDVISTTAEPRHFW
ncbi:hypothetical protein [Streptomyces sp. NPDC059873]|uniref:hypothetical protein n=1 Tax=Streptomyces sp. NPDC059873 TaxID=3346982 RepID=UPI00365D56F6